MIALGTLVGYTHRADVVRLAEGFGLKTPEQRDWIFQGKGGSSNRPTLTKQGDGHVVTFTYATPIRSEPAHFAVEPRDSDNKSVMVWPEEGSGVVTGLITKQIGRSVGHGGSNSEGDWEPGWFEARAKVNLYVVRWELRGHAFALVPEHAARPVWPVSA